MSAASSPLLVAAVLAVSASVGAGCTFNPEGRAENLGADAEATSSLATAIIVVERTSGPGETSRADSVVARFVRVRQGAVDDQALRIAGVAEDLPAVGTCLRLAELEGIPHARSVDLLEVGSLSIDASPAHSTILQPRAMPDPAGVVSGVFYSAKAARSSDLFAPGAKLQVRATGGRDLDGFVVNVTTPRDVADVRVANSPAGLDVSWDSTDADPADLVYVDVLSPAPAARVIARCTSTERAEGAHLLVPTLNIPGIEEGQVAVHRVHREPFRAKGIDPGEVRFDVARVISFHR